MIPPLVWAAFIPALLFMLALDLGVFHRRSHTVGFREALAWSGVWVGLALAFNAGLYFWRGEKVALEFFTGYLLEKSLSVDNLFVIALLFAYFRVPSAYQHRVLFWGVAGALVMRAALILVGAALIERFHWVLYVFGAFLVLTGVKLLALKGKQVDPGSNPMLKLFRRAFPVAEEHHGPEFFVRRGGKLFATPLFLVLLMVEFTDLVFAVDSIPAVFGITRDPFLVFSSNAFAILGLRSLYFLLAGVIDRFHYLSHGLAVVLGFIGVKMMAVDVYQVPVGLSLAVIAGVLGISVAVSFLKPPAHVSPTGKGEETAPLADAASSASPVP